MRLLTYIFLLLFLSSCMEFRFSAPEMHDFLTLHKEHLYSDTLVIHDQNIHYVYSNKGHEDLVVFIHGSPGSWKDFSAYLTTDSLLDHFDMVSIDRPGFGYSDYGLAEPSLKNQAFLMSEVLKKFDHQRKILVGHSLGGPVIARIAVDEPEQAQGLLFLAPSIDPEMEKFEWFRPLIQTWLGDLITPTDFWVSNEEIVTLKGELEAFLPLWSEIRIPCIVVHGTKDTFVPVENADFAKRMIVDSLITVKYLEGVHHFIPWTHAPVIVDSIKELVN